MNRKIIFKVTLCIAVGLIFSIILNSTLIGKKNISDSNNTAVGYKYTIKEFNGNVAVFSFGSTYPIEVLECPLKSLPDDEAQKLSAGIDIETEEELQQLIEAYD